MAALRDGFKQTSREEADIIHQKEAQGQPWCCFSRSLRATVVTTVLMDSDLRFTWLVTPERLSTKGHEADLTSCSTRQTFSALSPWRNEWSASAA
mmetsp:Transcript_179838/g.437599  ORF Transcript_179838/g.437599 Transcript_179838/m.437599 type:complete len:95 (-) Transcript_179838:6-290(-)